MNNDQTPAPVAEQPTIEGVIETLSTERHVSVPFETDGRQYEVTIRYENGIYRCETPLQRHTYETEKQVRSWLLGQGYVASE